MNIQREEITINQLTSGTTLMYFSTHLLFSTENIQRDPDLEYIPSILELNNLNFPVRISTFDGENIWTMNDDNNYVPISTVSNNYVTGHSFVQDVNRILNETDIDNIKERFSDSIDEGIAESTGNTNSYRLDDVFTTFHEIDDFFVNIKLNRTFGTLDTLNIYNNLVNSYPTQEADTGVVFGRLMALQSIKDTEGNNIKIPLRNTPIGIFNPSEDYPISSSVSENGDRLYLNAKESSFEDEYFNIESFSADSNNYLRSVSEFSTVPDQYKYVTTTNENGEFIIYNAPVGSQIVVFEVDLFKQGLTKDEIALNFFPFPADNDNILDTIPNFSFKQFPINVLPAWGTIQTGYTELNITVNIDLRKWATYYIPPIAYDGNLLGSPNLFNFSPSLNVKIRDMSKEGFPIKNIPVVEIHNIYDKDEDHTFLWDGEFAQLKKTAKFYDHGFKAFKVRANMYDPKGYRTDLNGIPRTHPTSQGVWLAGYQFKLYYNEPTSIFRTTGFERNWGYTSPNWRGRDHFHLNRGEVSDTLNADVEPLLSPPYDRPWNHLYPNEYSIPSRPTELNFIRNDVSTRLPGSYPVYLEQPEYTDGDLIGLETSGITNAGGDGVQYSSTNSFWFANRFSKEVTSSFIYKYEKGVAWNESYANGYNPSNATFSVQPGISQVVNGEKYQRVECGYGYWLRPDGWPPVSPEPWGDTIYSQATRPGVGLTTDFEPGVLPVGTDNGNIKVQVQDIPIDVYNIEDKDLALALDNKATYSEGGLNLYRVIDPNDRIERGPTVIPTSAIYNFQSIFVQRGPVASTTELRSGYDDTSNNNDDEFFSRIGGSGHADALYNNYLQIQITNNGNISVTIPNTSTTLDPGETNTFDAANLGLNGLGMELPGNSNYDFNSSKYTKANYSMKFKNISPRKNDGSTLANGHSAAYDMIIEETSVIAESTPPDYWLTTVYYNVKTQYNNNNETCQIGNEHFSGSGVKWKSRIKMNGPMFPIIGNGSKTGSSLFGYFRFEDAQITQTCGGGVSFNNNKVSIAIEVF